MEVKKLRRVRPVFVSKTKIGTFFNFLVQRRFLTSPSSKTNILRFDKLPSRHATQGSVRTTQARNRQPGLVNEPKSRDCFDFGINEGPKILDSAEYHHRSLQFANRYLEYMLYSILMMYKLLESTLKYINIGCPHFL